MNDARDTALTPGAEMGDRRSFFDVLDSTKPLPPLDPAKPCYQDCSACGGYGLTEVPDVIGGARPVFRECSGCRNGAGLVRVDAGGLVAENARLRADLARVLASLTTFAGPAIAAAVGREVRGGEQQQQGESP